MHPGGGRTSSDVGGSVFAAKMSTGAGAAACVRIFLPRAGARGAPPVLPAGRLSSAGVSAARASSSSPDAASPRACPLRESVEGFGVRVRAARMGALAFGVRGPQTR